MSAHTPGPWRDGGREHEGQINIVSRDGYYVANVIGGMAVEIEQANARLISSAPDMKAVLDDLEDAFDKQIFPAQFREDSDDPDDREYTVTITAKQWRALGRALGKAENGQS